MFGIDEHNHIVRRIWLGFEQSLKTKILHDLNVKFLNY